MSFITFIASFMLAWLLETMIDAMFWKSHVQLRL